MIGIWITAAHAAEWSVQLGAREGLAENGFVEGGTVGLRARAGRWEVGAAQYVRVANDAPSPLTAILLDRAVAAGAMPGEYAQPEDVDTSATLVWGSWGPAGERGFWGTPRLVAGIEGRFVARRMYEVPPAGELQDELGSVTTAFAIGPAFGFAYDVRLASPLGLRLTVLERVRVGRDTAYTGDGYGEGRRLYGEPTMSLDLSWSL